MENTNVLKTALGVGVLGTAAVALGFYYFNEDDTKVESELHPVESITSNVDKKDESITDDVIAEIASKKSQMQSFWESTYKSITEPTQENNDDIDN